MALSRTAYTATVVHESGSNTVTTGTHTFPNGELVVVIFVGESNSNNLNPSSQFSIDDTGANLTWSVSAEIDSGIEDYGVAAVIFTAIGNGTPCTLTVTSGSDPFYNCRVHPFSYSGQHATPIGAIFQAAEGPTDGAWAPNLSAAPASSSEVIGVIMGAIDGGPGSVNHGTGCTELWEDGLTGWYVSHGQVRTGSTDQAFGWLDVIVGATYYHEPCAVAIEVVAAASSAATLSSPTPSGTLGTMTTASLGATTNQTSGTLYGVVDSAANLSGVTASQVKAGQKASGAAAAAAGTTSVSTTTPSIGITGLSSATLYSYAIVQNNTNGDSNMVTGTFTTASVTPNPGVRLYGLQGSMRTIVGL